MKTDTCGGGERGCGVVDGLAFHLEGKNKLLSRMLAVPFWIGANMRRVSLFVLFLFAPISPRC